MSRRLVAFLAALLLMALPVAKVMCEVTCAHDVASTGSGHACCHETQGSRTASLGTLAQLCDHPADAPTTSQLQDASSTPAVAMNVVALVGGGQGAHRAASHIIPHRSDPLSLTTQLRI